MKLAGLMERLSSIDGDLSVVGDRGGRIRAMVRDRPLIPYQVYARSRLLIDARAEPFPLPPCGPRLVLADCPPEHWQDEVAAALECVWPTAT